jgi:hypothetical protein
MGKEFAKRRRDAVAHCFDRQICRDRKFLKSGRTTSRPTEIDVARSIVRPQPHGQAVIPPLACSPPP